MFSGLVNLLFGSPETDNTRKSTELIDTEANQTVSNSINLQPLSTEAAEEDGWLLVNKDEEVIESRSSSDSEENLNLTSNWENLRLKPKPLSLNRRNGNGLRKSIRHDAMLRSSAIYPSSSSMEESWFITPPPCFTSTGPVYMKTSPYENLLIEHPSMSVYHSMTYVREIIKKRNATPPPPTKDEQENIEECSAPPVNIKQRRAKIQRRPNREINVERVSDFHNLLNQIVDKRHSEKVHDKREYQAFSRGALKRANQAREFNGKGNRKRRSDLQHSRFNSGANNNRKC